MGPARTGLARLDEPRSPSAASAERMCSATRRRSSSRPSASSVSNERATRAFTVRLADPLPAASAVAISSTAGATVPAGTTRLTRPQASASGAVSQPPSSISSLARRAPMSRGSRWLPPPPATSPKFAC